MPMHQKCPTRTQLLLPFLDRPCISDSESGTKVIVSVEAIDDSKDLMKEAIAWCCGLAVNNSTRIRGCSFGKKGTSKSRDHHFRCGGDTKTGIVDCPQRGTLTSE